MGEHRLDSSYARSSGSHCSVYGCSYNQKKLNFLLAQPCFDHKNMTRKQCPCKPPYKLHKIPDDPDIKRQWLAALNRKNPPKNVLVCSFHFVDKKPTTENPIPEVNLGYLKKRVRKRRINRCCGSDTEECAVTEPSVHGNRKQRHRKRLNTGGDGIMSSNELEESKDERKESREAGGIKKEASGKKKPTTSKKDVVCCALGCRNAQHRKSGADKSFFHFPREKVRCALWLRNMKRQDLQDKCPSELRSEGWKLCSAHFTTDQFSRMGQSGTRTLLRNAVPTVLNAPRRQRPRKFATGLEKDKQEKGKSQAVVPEVKLEIDFAEEPSLFGDVPNCSTRDATEEHADLSENVPIYFADHSYIKPEPEWDKWETSATPHIASCETKAVSSAATTLYPVKSEMIDEESRTCVKSETFDEEYERHLLDYSVGAVVKESGESCGELPVTKLCHSDKDIKQEPLECDSDLPLNVPVVAPQSEINESLGLNGKDKSVVQQEKDSDFSEGFLACMGSGGENVERMEMVMMSTVDGDEQFVVKMEPESDYDET